MSPPRVWLITGGSTGLGYNLICHALEQGDTVVATMRNPASSGGQELTSKYATHAADGRLLVLKLDVKSSQNISEVFKIAKEKYKRIDVVFNNAGVFMCGEFEGTPEDKAREMFDTNFWGAANVTRESIQAFRENSPPGGRLLQVSSSNTMDSIPGTSYYAATKAALDSVSDCLVKELDPSWNIKITILVIGTFGTKAFDGNETVFPSPPAYASSTLGSSITKSLLAAGAFLISAGDPAKGAKMFYRLSNLENPPLRLHLHPGANQSSMAKIESLQKDIEPYTSWSDEIF